MNFWNLGEKMILLPLVNCLCLDSESLATNIYCEETQMFPWNKAVTDPPFFKIILVYHAEQNMVLDIYGNEIN